MTETPVVNPYQRRILLALNTLGKHVYAGKETPRDRAERRLGERQAALAAMPDNRARRRGVARLAAAEARRARRAAAREGAA